MDAIESYREFLPLNVTGFDHATGLCFGLASLAAQNAPGTGDAFTSPEPYTLHVLMLSDRRSFHAREALLGSTWSGLRGSRAEANRYGYYRWIGAGLPRAVIASSADPASMIAFAAEYQAGRVSDIALRLTMLNSVHQPHITWIAPANSIFYEPKRNGEAGTDTWLMSWPVTDPARPNWTMKTARLPYPGATHPRAANWGNPAYMVIAHAIAHSGGYLSLYGLPADLSGTFNPTAPVFNNFEGKTIVEILGPPNSTTATPAG